MSNVKRVPITEFSNVLKSEYPGAGKYICPVCGAVSLTIDLSNEADIGFACSNGCSQPDILQSLGHDPHAVVFVQRGNASLLAGSDVKQPKQRLMWETLLCELGARGWLVSFNLITQEVEVHARTAISNRPMSMDDLITALHSDLADKYKGCTLDTLHAYVSYVARENAVNPVLDLISTTTWDGVDRTQTLYDLMGIQADELSKTLVMKWLLQTCALLYNDEEDPFGADGVLVLNGGQGVGKTSLFKHLALRPQWFCEGATIKDNDKDTSRRCITRWITELGEVESTLKSDISALKAFVTSDMDVYRTPYARSDRKAARRTSLCATCNSDRYLIDPTGNRRWWSVPISAPMDYEKIQKFDALQLWAQVHSLIAPLSQQEKAACFRLNREEQAALAARNGEFERSVKGEEECRDLIDEAKQNGYVWEFMTPTHWKQENIDVLRPYSANQIGAALQKIGFVQTTRRIGKNPTKGYELPTRIPVSIELRRIK